MKKIHDPLKMFGPQDSENIQDKEMQNNQDLSFAINGMIEDKRGSNNFQLFNQDSPKQNKRRQYRKQLSLFKPLKTYSEDKSEESKSDDQSVSSA